MATERTPVTAGLLAFLFAFTMTFGSVFFFWPQPFVAGLSLLVWGFFLLVRLVQLGKLTAVTHSSETRSSHQLPFALLAQLRRADFGKKEGNLAFVAHPAFLAVLMLGSVYFLLALGKADSSGAASVMLCGMLFWLSQGYALESRQARAVMTVGIAGILIAASNLAIALPVHTDSAFAQRLAEHGMAGAFLVYGCAGLCATAFVHALINRRRNRGFAWLSLALVGTMALADWQFSPSPPLLAFWLCCWTVLGAGWAQSWPRSRRNYVLFPCA
ncbi:MAG: hypothetical protein EOM26_00815 [Alphaproteobacteria bacterium]|nr:hypothetical protein [Alphaproteobacteria bacterium]